MPPSWSALRRKGLKQIEQSVRYADATRWLLGDFFRFLGWGSLTITLIGTASVGIKFGAAALLHVFVRALAEQETIQLPGLPDLSFNIRDFFVAGVVAGLILMAVSTLLQFQVRLVAIRAARRYEEYCTRRLVNLASRLPHRDAGWASEVSRSEPLQGFFAHVRAAGLLARQFTQLLPSLISFCLACLVLLWLNPATTTSLAVVALLVMLFQYPLNNRAARASTKNEQHRREASQRLGLLFNQLRQGPVPLAADGAVLNVLFERRGPLGRDLASFSRRVDGGVLAMMVSRLGTHVLLGMVLLTLGLDIIAGRQSWADIAVYVVVVQFALRDFLAVGKLLSSVSRYYGQVERYMKFVRSASAAPERARSDLQSEQRLTLNVPSMDGRASSLTLDAGEVIAVFTPAQGSAPLAVMFLDALVAPAGEHVLPPAWIDASVLDERILLVDNLALPAATDLAALEDAVLSFRPEDASPLKPGWLQRTPASFRNGLPDWAICALKVRSALERGHMCLAIEAQLWNHLPEAWRWACRQCLSHRTLFILHHHPGLLGRYGERVALIGDTNGLLCWAPIDKDSLNAVKSVCRRLCAHTRTKTLTTSETALLLDE